MKPLKKPRLFHQGELPRGTLFVDLGLTKYAVFIARGKGGKHLPGRSRIFRYDPPTSKYVESRAPDEAKILRLFASGAFVPRSRLRGLIGPQICAGGRLCAAQIAKNPDGSVDYKKSKAYLMYSSNIFSEVANPKLKEEIIDWFKN